MPRHISLACYPTGGGKNDAQPGSANQTPDVWGHKFNWKPGKQSSVSLADLIRPLDLKGSAEPVALTHSNDCDRCSAVIPSLRAITLTLPVCSPQLFFFSYVTCEENSTCDERLPSSQSANRLSQVTRFRRLETRPSAHGNLSTCAGAARTRAGRLFLFWHVYRFLALFLPSFHDTGSFVFSRLRSVTTSETLIASMFYPSGPLYLHDAFNIQYSKRFIIKYRRGVMITSHEYYYTVIHIWSADKVSTKTTRSLRRPFSRLLIILIRLSRGSSRCVPH